MALPTISSILLLLLVTVTAILPGTSTERITLASLLECYPAPSSTANGGAFRADLLSLLGDLPSAAAPTGFASMQSKGAGGDSVFARALCFGNSPPSQCLACVSTAVKNITGGCAASRRAGIWSDGCFLAYGDTDASSASEDAVRRRIFSGDAVPPTDTFDLPRLVNLAQDLAPRAAKIPGLMLATADGNGAGKSTVHALAQCMRDRTAADCARCLRDSAREVSRCYWRLDGMHGGVAAVFGFNCYLRFETSTPPFSIGERLWKMIKDNLVVTVGIVIVVVGASVMLILYTGCWRLKRKTG